MATEPPDQPADPSIGQADPSTGPADPSIGQAEPMMERPLDPTKLMRIAAMVREVLDEMRRRDPSPQSANDLAELYKKVQVQLEEAIPEFLATELSALELDIPFEDGATADEVRVAYSGLMGWLSGLFQGLQASFQAQAQLHMNEPPTLTEGATRVPGKKEGYL